MNQKIIYTNRVGEAIDSYITQAAPSSIFVIVDTNTAQLVLPALAARSQAVSKAGVITCKAGDANKNLDELQAVWRSLSTQGATRSSMIINVGGGVVTDLGGFAAATFKRGIRSINVPTTLLGAVDAAIGGKTGINFDGYKNEIGAFNEADAVIISTVFFTTLPQQQLLSGYAEMLKHGLLKDKATFARLPRYDIASPDFDPDKLLPLLEASVQVKQNIVAADPTEHGLRKALNLGHTIGHSFESLALERKSPIAHGYAVAWGLVCELVLSHMQCGFPADTLHMFADYVRDNYGTFDIGCKDYPHLIEYMQHDKKNASPDQINFTLLEDIGRPLINRTADPDQIKAALDIYRDLMGI